MFSEVEADRPHKLVRTLLSTRPKQGSLSMALAGILLLSILFAIDQRDFMGLSSKLSASTEQVFGQHEYWRLFTSSLIHADLGHLLSNALFFGVFAFLLNGYFGAAAFPLVSLLAGGVINFVTLLVYPEPATLLGASGIVYFMVAFWLALYFGIERGMPPVRRAMNAMAFALVLFFPESFDQRVSYLSHAVGFVLGLPAGAVFFVLNRKSLQRFEVWQEPEPASEPRLARSLTDNPWDSETDGGDASSSAPPAADAVVGQVGDSVKRSCDRDRAS